MGMLARPLVALRRIRILPRWVRRMDARAAAAINGHRHLPSLDRALARLSHLADRSGLWIALSVVLYLSGGRRRRAAVRGVGSLVVGSAIANLIGKRIFGGDRPLLKDVPVPRRLKRMPTSASFPSGHSASAAAFVTGVALESPPSGAVLAPLGAAVAYSRLHTGAHWLSDVIGGVALGSAVAVGGRMLVPAPPRVDTEPSAPEIALPALARCGRTRSTSCRRRRPPPASTCWRRGTTSPRSSATPSRPPHRPASSACGAVTVRWRRWRMPRVAWACRCSCFRAARSTISRARPGCPRSRTGSRRCGRDRGAAGGIRSAGGCRRAHHRRAAAAHGAECGTVGVYPDFVAEREAMENHLGKPVAALIAAIKVLAGADTIDVRVDGRTAKVWSVAVAAGENSSVSMVPLQRRRLDDAVLDVRVLHARGRMPRLRGLVALAFGVRASAVLDRVPWRARLATIEAYSTVQPSRIPAMTIQDGAEAAPTSTDVYAVVYVPTSVGEYTIELRRDDPSAAWGVTRFQPSN
ncbi:phosphatase PAP2 family protein [Microbacterium sp. EF45047]|nr:MULTISPECIES: phosphatase PAP2 family protein [Microbacterium]UWF76573.1 phosphatase PAP2 family protein [Microbacterium neungamense]WCM54726.1 phosphatase PAP2 family protein [Microbacterium sp. EF45047]